MGRMIMIMLSLGLLITACATTQESSQEITQSNFKGLCRSIDTNHDGRISRDELLAAAKNKEEAATIFDMCDVEHQGSITYDQAYRNRMLEQVIRLTTPGVR